MSKNFTKKNIVLHVAERTQLPQKLVQDIVQCTIDAIAQAFSKGKDVELRNFGVFELTVRKQRIGRNPNKPEQDVPIPERVVVKFKAGKGLKASLKGLDPDKI